MNTRMKNFAFNVVLMAVTIAVAIAVGSQLPGLYSKWQGPSRSGDFSAHVDKLPQRVTLYGTTTCQYCQTARDYLKQAGIPFNDQVIDTSPSASTMFEQLSETSVPVLVVRDKLIVGFNATEYHRFLKAAAR
ncbi:glutaredoxin family protein [Massilia sp. PAMC28688]|uniref:glutaredoxin family protein n=1 Tax=Massilia sp. PAMC28688 TaxID=2861283 RepID=UPI001C631168|nr:glutaredoxin family protein [Massilia sp. PAMC28688]QYF95486.1 glutaredoxin family protein [Massilia sp. PAMC28688]